MRLSVRSGMAESYPRDVPVSGLGTKPRLMALGVVLILGIHASFGQDFGKSLISPAARLRMGVVTTIARGCSTISSSVLQQDAETRLRGAGVTVSSIHTVQLGIDLDCAADTSGLRNARNLQQCLRLSETVYAPSERGRVNVVTTWKQCQSYSCPRGQCEPLLRSGLNTLLDVFLNDIQKRRVHRDGPVPQKAQPEPQRPFSRASLPALDINTVRLIFYLLYIMTCLCVLLHWQLHKQHC